MARAFRCLRKCCALQKSRQPRSAEYPSGQRGRIANPLCVSSNLTSASSVAGMV